MPRLTKEQVKLKADLLNLFIPLTNCVPCMEGQPHLIGNLFICGYAKELGTFDANKPVIFENINDFKTCLKSQFNCIFDEKGELIHVPPLTRAEELILNKFKIY